MRFNEALCYSMPPMHFALQNNNQLQRSSSEIIINVKEDSLALDHENQEFRLGQDTSTYSSLANVTRHNKINEHNNNLDYTFQSSSTESLPDDYQVYYEEPRQDLSGSDWSVYSEDGNLPAGCRGIVNPNYPGFQHLGPSLLSETDDSDAEEDVQCLGPAQTNEHEDEFNNNNNNNIEEDDEDEEDEDDEDDENSDSDDDYDDYDDYEVEDDEEEDKRISAHIDEKVNRFDAQIDDQKQLLYEKPKFHLQSIGSTSDRSMDYAKNSTRDPSATSEIYHNEDVEVVQLTTSVKETLQFPQIEQIPDSSKSSEAEETEDFTTENLVDLIREVNERKSNWTNLNSIDQSQSNVNSSSINNNNSNVSPTKSKNEQQATLTTASKGKLDEIDLLASINRRPESRCCNQEHHSKRQLQQQLSVPDVVAIEPDAHRRAHSESTDENKKLPKNRMVQQCQEPQQPALRQHFTRDSQISSKQDAKQKNELESGSFDVYNIETAMPKIDMDAIESHLKAAREEERRRRNDREEIRRRLAMGPDAEDVRNERGRKPSLQARLQSGMNLQICFMNETSSDSESAPGPDGLELARSAPSLGSPTNSSGNEGRCFCGGGAEDGRVSDSSGSSSNGTSSGSSSSSSSMTSSPTKTSRQQNVPANSGKPLILSLPSLKLETSFATEPFDEADFFARQARLQTEARMALAQAKEMAHMQMEVERQKLKQNPITEMVRASLQKIGVTLGEERRRLTRALLTELNIAQLQVLANDLHARIAKLNEALVEGLLRRDDLHMEQDSMLVDVEDLTRYLGAKQESFKKRQQQSLVNSKTGLSQQYKQQQQQTSRGKTLALLSKATSSPRLAAGRQLVVNLVRK